jgi:hypothetical protein
MHSFVQRLAEENHERIAAGALRKAPLRPEGSQIDSTAQVDPKNIIFLLDFNYYFRLEVWPGYVTAVDEHEGGLLLCCDTSSKVLRTQTVLELM